MSLMRFLITAPFVLLYHNLYMLLRASLDSWQNTNLRVWMFTQSTFKQQKKVALRHQLNNQQKHSVARYLKGFSDASDSMMEKHVLWPYHTSDNLGTSAGLHNLAKYVLGKEKVHETTLPHNVYGFTLSPVRAVKLAHYLRARKTKKTGDMLEYLVITGVITAEETFIAFGVQPNSPEHTQLFNIPWTDLKDLSIRTD